MPKLWSRSSAETCATTQEKDEFPESTPSPSAVPSVRGSSSTKSFRNNFLRDLHNNGSLESVVVEVETLTDQEPGEEGKRQGEAA